MKNLKVFKLFFQLSLGVMLVWGCQNKNDSSTEINEDSTQVSSSTDNVFIHYWDDFDFADTISVMNPEVGEQKLVDFIVAFPNVSETVRSLAINNMLSKAKHVPTSFEYFTEQFDHYLYDPNSPMRNDLYYEPVLEFIIDSAGLLDAERRSYANLLNLVRKNRVGSQASDIKFLLPDGGNASLHNMSAPFTMLFFYEPGCSFCETSIDQIKSSSYFQQLLNKDMLEILAIYPYSDLAIWKKYQKEIPINWTNGFDSEGLIIEKGLYDIRATPTIYLLDKDKKVLLKDADLNQLARFLANNASHS